MPTADKMVKVAASYIGTKGDHNIFNKWYWCEYTKEYSSDPGTAWCACFVSYVAMKAGLKCKYSASAAAVGTQFERIPLEKENTVRKGDIVVFNWDGRTDLGWCDHVGIVEWATIGDNGLFGTIEGNTGNAAEGQVLRVTRDNNSTYFTAFFRPKYDSAATSQKTQAKNPQGSSSQKLLYGIDVSSNQPENVCSLVKYDFAIVKMSGNPHGYAWDFVNPFAARQAREALGKTGCLGLYHFTYGKDAVTEAKFFVDQVKKLGYLGKAMLVVDYEGDALSLGRIWVSKFADTVKKQAGYSPVIYASGSVITEQNLKVLGYPIWCANYYKGYQNIQGYDTSGMKIWPGCEDALLWQFTSEGYLDGYSKALDLNVFYGSKDDFKKHMGKTSGTSASTTKPSTSTSTSKKKSIETVAKEVIAGKWGNGEDRKKKLTAAGYSYKKVQAKVNELLSAASIESVARDVIAGKYGNGAERISALRAAGYDPDKVQEKVNELLS